MKFTQLQLKNLKPQKEAYRIRETNGFVLRVLPSGLKRFEYIYTMEGRRRVMSLGVFEHANPLCRLPTTSLSEAREKHIIALAKVQTGVDPQAAPPPMPEAPEKLTVRKLAERWFKWSEEHHVSKWANTLKLAVEKDVLSTYGDRDVSDIRRKDAIEILETKAKTAPGQARNLHKALRGMWQYAIDREIVEHNPFSEWKAAKTIPTMKQKSRDRHLSDDEIKLLWHAIDAGGGTESTRRALKMILLTGQRPGEVCGMHSREIQLGVGKKLCDQCRRCGWWTIPEERRQGNKGGEHRVYLPPLAIELIGDWDGYVFPGNSLDHPISENSTAYHVRREVELTGKVKYYGLDRFTPHDLRRTAGTGLRRLGASRDTMDLILGHAVAGVTGVYDRYSGDPEKVQWLIAWTEHIRSIV